MTISGVGGAAKEGESMILRARASGESLGVLLEGIQEGSRRRNMEDGARGGGVGVAWEGGRRVTWW